MSNIAIIDLGTNTFNLLIANTEGKILHNEKIAVRLGKKGISRGLITEDAFDRALSTMQYYKTKATEWNTTKIVGIATSAVRNASNGTALAEAIKNKTGIEVRIISGKEEADYIYKGVRKAMDLGSEMNLVIDIGGGSVEYIIGNNTDKVWSQSYEIGALRLFEQFHTNDPIPQENIKQLNDYLSIQLATLYNAVNQYKPQTLIGSSGTFDTLAEINFCQKNQFKTYFEKPEYTLTLDEYHSISSILIKNDRATRLAIPGMIEMRADLIVVACLLINFTIEQFNIKNIRISSYSLKEGILYSLLNPEHN